MEFLFESFKNKWILIIGNHCAEKDRYNWICIESFHLIIISLKKSKYYSLKTITFVQYEINCAMHNLSHLSLIIPITISMSMNMALFSNVVSINDKKIAKWCDSHISGVHILFYTEQKSCKDRQLAFHIEEMRLVWKIKTRRQIHFTRFIELHFD